MKQIIIIILISFLSINIYSQENKDTIKNSFDSSYIMTDMSKDIDTISTDIKEISKLINGEYKRLGPKNFIKEYKYFIIVILIFLFLTILWSRNRKI